MYKNTRLKQNIDKTSIAFVIRMHYKENDTNYKWRFNYFTSMVLPKLLSQEIKGFDEKLDFDICIWANGWQKKDLEALSPKIKVFNVRKEKQNYVSPEWKMKAKRYHIDFQHFEDVVGMKKYDIQIAIDSDDLLIRNDYIKKIYFESMTYKDKHVHLTFQPYVFDVSNLKTYRSHITYDKSRGSAFYALYQPNKEKYLFAYHTTHQKMPSLAEKIIVVGEGYCAYSVHGKNDSSNVVKGMRQITI